MFQSGLYPTKSISWMSGRYNSVCVFVSECVWEPPWLLFRHEARRQRTIHRPIQAIAKPLLETLGLTPRVAAAGCNNSDIIWCQHNYATLLGRTTRASSSECWKRTHRHTHGCRTCVCVCVMQTRGNKVRHWHSDSVQQSWWWSLFLFPGAVGVLRHVVLVTTYFLSHSRWSARLSPLRTVSQTLIFIYLWRAGEEYMVWPFSHSLGWHAPLNDDTTHKLFTSLKKNDTWH